MSDIVERLRIPHSCMWKLNNAASAIEMYEEDRSEAADALTAANARIAELERELEARKNYTDADYVRLHKAHCFTANKLATALRAFAEREKEMLEALKEAEFGLEAIVGFYARVTFTGSRVAADEQNPCISIAMKAQNVARAILDKREEKS